MPKYKGPARGIPTRRELISDRAELIIYAVLAIVLAVILYLD